MSKKKWIQRDDNQWGINNGVMLAMLLIGLFSACGAFYMVMKFASMGLKALGEG